MAVHQSLHLVVRMALVRGGELGVHGGRRCFLVRQCANVMRTHALKTLRLAVLMAAVEHSACQVSLYPFAWEFWEFRRPLDSFGLKGLSADIV